MLEGRFFVGFSMTERCHDNAMKAPCVRLAGSAAGVVAFCLEVIPIRMLSLLCCSSVPFTPLFCSHSNPARFLVHRSLFFGPAFNSDRNKRRYLERNSYFALGKGPTDNFAFIVSYRRES